MPHRCVSCKNFVSNKASLHGRNQCKKCRRKNGTLVWTCKYRFKNGVRCHELNHDYHVHCVRETCNGAVYCSLCIQCPVCDEHCQ